MLSCSPMKRKRRTVGNMMEVFENVLLNASEFIKGRLFFVSLNTDVKPKSTPSVHYFTIDSELNYDSFYLDFGPLNLAMLYHYCVKLRRKLSNPAFHNKKIVHYTGADVQKARKRSIFDWCIFSGFVYHYERVENGDFNWILPNKFIAFCGPHNRSKLDKGYPIHSPETYFAYFRRHKVTTIIRLNKKAYDSNRFVQAGFDHKDLYFVDGGTPSDRILQHFISICESAKGAVAVHCKAGLGRTGSLIACYIMKHYKFTAEEAIAWIRICRPGSIIGHQQSWLQEKQKPMWDVGELYRKKNGITGLPKHTVGIYSLSELNRKKSHDNVTGIVKKVDCMEINDPEEEFEENNITQGDKLNEIKAQRTRAKPLVTSQTERLRRVHVSSSPTTQTVLRGGKILSSTSPKTSGSTSNRLVAKRIETKEPQPIKRGSTRKLTSPITTSASEKLQLGEKRQIIKKSPLSRLTKNGISYQNGTSLKCASPDEKQIKRGKRTLALEKDKASPRSVKVLRRSHVLALSLKDCEKPEGKLRLPSVKINKTL
ncbi:hypothetical protein NQ314_012347 [Rhamnusium bicolor]|uniref:protein-tyrosine-phosphatase n=1 Tax=Rhamnusium bicolor TaxID=1586634 RepID=A0AAV8XEL3_9CUCU|nr:hypothetical protein NQ314_012347 [Rhamnusium bicolor]